MAIERYDDTGWERAFHDAVVANVLDYVYQDGRDRIL